MGPQYLRGWFGGVHRKGAICAGRGFGTVHAYLVCMTTHEKHTLREKLQAKLADAKDCAAYHVDMAAKGERGAPQATAYWLEQVVNLTQHINNLR